MRWLLRVDERGVLRFAPLQSAPGQAFLRAHGLPGDDFDTLIFVPDWERPAPVDYLVRTDGVLAACAAAGGVARELANLRVLPRGLRDAGYKTIARLRYVLFGRYVPRPLPCAEWERRFLSR